MSKHPIVHVELSSTNLEADAKFYAEVFDWNVEQMPEMNYASFEPGEGVGGGFNPVQEGVPAGAITIYIGTDDIDASLAKIEHLGGKAITPRTEIPGFGWFGLFKDLSGNLVGLYTTLPR